MIDPTTRTLEKGDVVQLAPDGPNKLFAGCFMVVDEVRPWGAQGYVCVPQDKETMPGKAYYRAQREDMVWIGKAEWVLE